MSHPVLKLRDFGPIREADIPLAPFTVLVGKSGTGKTYAAEALYAVTAATRSKLERTRALTHDLRWENAEAEAQQLQAGLAANHASMLPLPGVGAFNTALGEKLGTAVLDDLGRVHAGGGHDRLIRTGSDQALVELVSEKKSIARLAVRRGTATAELHFQPHAPLAEDGSVLTNTERWVALLFQTRLRRTFFLPTGRTALLLASPLIAHQAIARLAGTDAGPLLPATYADFLADTFSTMGAELGQERAGHWATLATNLDDIVGGEFAWKQVAGGHILVQRTPLGERQMHEVAAGSAELAPLTLLLRHSVNKGHAVIIEEPEAHLHPDAQRAVTRVLAILANAGVHVVITTHSPYILQELGNLVLGGDHPTGATALGLSPSMVLARDSLSVVRFSATESGSVTGVLRYTEDGELPDPFVESAERMYDDIVALRSAS